MEKFTITKDHLKLLQRMYVSWDGGEYGAPAIDCKRPYGNGDVENDIAEILGWKLSKDSDGDLFLSVKQRDKAAKLHEETETVLQLCLTFQKFKEGTFQRKNSWDDWEEVKTKKHEKAI